MIVAARPTLNATMSASPSPTRWSAIAERRTTSADGHGSSLAATPTPRIPLAGVALVVMVVIAVVVAIVLVAVLVVAVVAAPARPEPLPEDRRADRDHEQAGHERQPRVEALGTTSVERASVDPRSRRRRPCARPSPCRRA